MRMRRKSNLETRLSACTNSLLFIEGEEFYQKSKEERVNIFDVKEIFKNDNPLWLENGCGKGQFALQTAKLNKDVNLIAVEKIYPENSEKKLLVNMDSHLPNKVAHEWLKTQGYSFIKPEFTFGKSRIDFYMEKDEEKFLMEVKGCTLEIDGIGYFPDAPTERGVKHLEELILASQQGYNCKIAFVIQMEGITEVRGNSVTHPEFAKTLEKAKNAGVEILFLCCRVLPDEVFVEKAIIG